MPRPSPKRSTGPGTNRAGDLNFGQLRGGSRGTFLPRLAPQVNGSARHRLRVGAGGVVPL